MQRWQGIQNQKNKTIRKWRKANKLVNEEKRSRRATPQETHSLALIV